MIVLLAFIVWYVIGILGFYYWWTSDFDMELYDFFLMLFAGLVGVFTWFMGYIIHGKSPNKIIIFKKRK